MATGGGTGTVLGKHFPCETNDLSRAARTHARGYGQRIFGRSGVSGQKLQRITRTKLFDPSYKLKLGFRLIDSNPAANFLFNFRTIIILSSDSAVKLCRNFDCEPWVFEFSPVSTNSSYLTESHRWKQFPIRASKPSNAVRDAIVWDCAIN